MTSWLELAQVGQMGQNAVPDYARQEAEKQMLRIQQMQADSQRGGLMLQAQKAQREQDQQVRFQGRMQEIAALPARDRPQAIAGLMGEFPEMSEGLQRSFQAMDKERQASDMRQLGELHSALSNGRADVAAKLLERRIAADKAAGEDTEDDEAMLAALKSGDSAAIAEAQNSVGYAIAAINPEKFAETYKAVNPRADPSTFQKEYEFILRTEGKEAADLFMQGKTDPVVNMPLPGGRVFVGPRSGITGLGGGANAELESKGGDPASSGAGGRVRPVSDGVGVARQLFPDAQITSGYRGPDHPLSKKNPRSYHARTHGAIDVKPIPGMTFTDYVRRYKDAGYTIIEAKNEVGKGRSRHATGDHWHVVIGQRGQQQAAGEPVRVRSKQQFEKLASGTVFIAPDGSRRVKP